MRPPILYLTVLSWLITFSPYKLNKSLATFCSLEWNTNISDGKCNHQKLHTPTLFLNKQCKSTRPYNYIGIKNDIGMPYDIPLNSSQLNLSTNLNSNNFFNKSCKSNTIVNVGDERSKLSELYTPAALCTGSLGDPVVNITFGAGNNPGRPLPAIVPGASTTLTYVAVNGNPASPTPIDGQYTITNNVPFNFAWHSGIADHTPNDTDGYMAFYNSQETPGLEFYSQTIANLCGSTTYEFAAWIANCLNPAMMDGVDPDITFRIERLDGTVLGSYNTGAIPETNNLTWKQFGFFFTMPANETTVILKMINNSVGGTALPGNDLAIDDITFRPCGPSTIVSFSNSAQVDSLTICEGSSATLFGNLSTGFNTPNYRWQSSTDNGTNWTDIASSNVLQLSVTPVITGISRTIHYRMIAGDGNNINSANCRISSNKIILTIRILPTGGIRGDSICPGQSGNITFTSSSLNSPFTISYSDGTGTLFANNMTNNGKIATGILFNNKTYALLSIKDAFGCERTNGFNPTTAVIEIRRSNFNAPASPLSVCETKSVQLKGNNNTTYNYQWIPATYLDNPTSPNPTSTPVAAIQYMLKISEPVCNYDSTFLVNVNVNPSPIVVAQSANDIDCSLPTSQLQASGGVSYVWTPSAGLDNPTKANPIASVSNTTTFIVTGTDQFGCTDTGSVSVKVTNGGKPVFVLPNAFTPNGDGLNECFGIQRWGNVTIKEFSIFNRWGQRIFTAKNPSACWDGTFKGQKQDVGGYTYVIKASSFCGEVKKTGILMLIR